MSANIIKSSNYLTKAIPNTDTSMRLTIEKLKKEISTLKQQLNQQYNNLQIELEEVRLEAKYGKDIARSTAEFLNKVEYSNGQIKVDNMIIPKVIISDAEPTNSTVGDIWITL